jgi:hypothetical protein
MSSEERILELLETMMESGQSPEEVCADAPELLPELRSRWEKLQDVKSQVELLFQIGKSHLVPHPFAEILPDRSFPKSTAIASNRCSVAAGWVLSTRRHILSCPVPSR